MLDHTANIAETLYSRNAACAGLRYVTDARPGMHYQRNGKGFICCPDGSRVREPRQLGRIKSLAMPPAYGVTPLKDRHITVEATKLRFRFTGKSGKQWSLKVKDRRIAKIIRAGPAIERVAARVGNASTVCRKCYVHPEVLSSYLNRTLVLNIKRHVEASASTPASSRCNPGTSSRSSPVRTLAEGTSRASQKHSRILYRLLRCESVSHGIRQRPSYRLCARGVTNPKESKNRD